ncbi:site-specific tyrosine recombinase XerC [compost metagenome]
MSSHMLRHGTAYSVLRSEHGKTMLDNLMVAQKVLGHADLSTTEVYTRVPAAALVRSSVGTASDPVIFRFEEAQRIFDETYIPSHAHRRKRRGIGDPHVRNPYH